MGQWTRRGQEAEERDLGGGGGGGGECSSFLPQAHAVYIVNRGIICVPLLVRAAQNRPQAPTSEGAGTCLENNQTRIATTQKVQKASVSRLKEILSGRGKNVTRVGGRGVGQPLCHLFPVVCLSLKTSAPVGIL